MLARSWSGYDLTTGVGDLTRDGRPRPGGPHADGRLWLLPAPARDALPGAAARLVVRLRPALGPRRRHQRRPPDLVARRNGTTRTYVFPGVKGSLGTPPRPVHRRWRRRPAAHRGPGHRPAPSDLVGRDARGRLVVFAATRSGRTSRARAASAAPSRTRPDPQRRRLERRRPRRRDHPQRLGRAVPLPRRRRTVAAARGRASPPGFGSVRLLAAVGDLTGDGHPDLPGPAGGRVRCGSTRATAGRGFRASYVAHAALTGTRQLGVGLWNADGSPDSVVRRSDGSLVLYPGNGPGGLTGGTRRSARSSRYDWLVAARRRERRRPPRPARHGRPSRHALAAAGLKRPASAPGSWSPTA